MSKPPYPAFRTLPPQLPAFTMCCQLAFFKTNISSFIERRNNEILLSSPLYEREKDLQKLRR